MTRSTPLLILLVVAMACSAGSEGDDTAMSSGEVTLAEIGTEADDGLSVLDGQVVTTAGVAMVGSGVLGGRKLRIHVQDGQVGLAVDADEVVAAQIVGAMGDIEPGDLLRLTGLVTSEDLASNSADAEVDGLIRLRIGDPAQVERLSSGNMLPDPIALALPDILFQGDTWEGALVALPSVRKVDDHGDTWVTSLDSTRIVDVLDTGGAGPLKVRLGNGENTGGYGDDPGTATFGLVGLLREDALQPPATDPEGTGFEIWPRSEADILRTR